MADRCDAVVIVGSDYTDVAAPSELSVNARIAVNLGAPVLLAVKGRDRSPDEVAQVVEMCLDEIAGQHALTVAVVANRCNPDELDSDRRRAAHHRVAGVVLPEVAAHRPLDGRTAGVDRRRRCSSATRNCCTAKRLHVMVAGMTAEHILERLTEGVVVIAPGDRSDVVLASSMPTRPRDSRRWRASS